MTTATEPVVLAKVSPMRGAHAELAEDVKKRVSTLWEDQPDLVAYGVGQSWGKSEETVEWKAGNCEVLVRIRYR